MTERYGWQWYGQARPPFAVEPGPGQESVWDFPRPPRVETDGRLVEVVSGDVQLARSKVAMRLLETASPPTFYVLPEDVNFAELARCGGSSYCEWKGQASYWSLRGSERPVAWSYDRPKSGFEALTGAIAFYPSRVQCFVAGERVEAQPGDFYGGWITRELVGPFKGEPGTSGW